MLVNVREPEEPDRLCRASTGSGLFWASAAVLSCAFLLSGRGG